MLILFVIIGLAGVFVFFLEQKNRKDNEAKFDEFVQGVKANSDLSDEEKKEHIRNLYQFNGFKIVQMNHASLTVSKKYFSLGAAMMWFGILGVGIIAYLVYLLFKRPEVKIIFFK